MYDVLDVSRYIINYCNQHSLLITNLKLQKLLYFIQAQFLLINFNNPCFYQKIEAWPYGPVVPEAYHEFKGFGNNHIPPITTFYGFIDKNKPRDILNYGIMPVDDNIIALNDKTSIQLIIESLKNCSPNMLVSVTHKQQPWIEAFSHGSGTEITLYSIYNFFKQQ